MFSLCMYFQSKSVCVCLFVFNSVCLFFVQIHFCLVLVYVYTLVCICQSTFMHVHEHKCFYLDVWMLVCMCMRACVGVCMHAGVSACVCARVCVCVLARYRATLTSGPYGLGFRAWNILRLMFIYKHTPRRTRLRDPCPSPTYSHHHHSSSLPLFTPCSFHPHVFMSPFCFFSLYYTINLLPSCSF